jgi:hypothetical protein
MTILKSITAALIAGTIAFGTVSPIAAPAFASDQGFDVAPVKQVKSQKAMKLSQKMSKSLKVVHFDKKTKQKAKYLVIGAAVGAIGYAILKSYED